MTITLYHNPACGTSRSALALLEQANTPVHIVEYLKTPPDKAALEHLVSRGIPARELLRSKEPLYTELGLDDPALSEDALLEALVTHPRLLNRPIVDTPEGARVCRPAEKVREVVPGLR